jgi:hypothetical protein
MNSTSDLSNLSRQETQKNVEGAMPYLNPFELILVT